MKNNEKRDRIWKNILWGTGMLLLLLLALIWYKVIEYDSWRSTINSGNNSAKIEIRVSGGNKSAESWETEIQVDANPENRKIFIGESFSVMLANNNRYDIKNWNMQFNINKECYLSGFWCGSIEVHQYRDGRELINSIANPNIDTTVLDIDRNVFTEKMMIHLMPGDYLVYYPSIVEHEDIVEAKNSVGIGFNLYYQDSLDLSDWSLSYMNDLKMFNLRIFKVFIVLVIIWIISFVQFLCISSFEKKLKKEMNNKIRDISIMADLYIEAYVINVSEDVGYLVKGDENALILGLDGKNVQEKLINNLSSFCSENYREKLVEFLQLDTIEERMSDASSIAFEYMDSRLGWCVVRVFRADSDNGNQVVLTLQDINEERNKLRMIEDRINTAEYKQSVSGSFMENVSFAVDDICRKICADGMTICDKSEQDDLKNIADRIVMNTKHMNLIQNMMMDLFRLECNHFVLNVDEYNIYDMLEEILHMLSPYSEGREYEFKIDIDDKMPRAMRGDIVRIKQILVIILFSSLMMTREGFVKFSVFGKQYEDGEEIIFSIRDTAGGFAKEQIDELNSFINGASIETFDNASLIYLKIINGVLKYMDSELKVVSVFGEGSDFYFALKQEIV